MSHPDVAMHAQYLDVIAHTWEHAIGSSGSRYQIDEH